jgi:uncharacterized protein YjiS (DUF1127 family)
LIREQCFYCTEYTIGSFWRHQPDCTETLREFAVNQDGHAGKPRADGIALPRGDYWRDEMSVTPSTMSRPAATPGSGRFIRRLLHAGAHEVAHFFFRRTAVKTLHELNDRELRDIGLRRDQIEAAVHGVISRPDRAGK